MQVLVVLADAGGQVVTRGTLFDRCWGGVFVGDDSLNRAIAAVRKVAAEIADGSFEIETIPRTGYRLTSSSVEKLDTVVLKDSKPPMSRRALIAGGAGVAVLAGGGLLWSIRSRDDERFDQLIGQAEAAIRTEDAGPRVLRPLEEAVAIRPASAKAWGLLAFFNVISAQLAEPKDAQPMTDRAQEAARRAFDIDPREPNALLAMFELQGSTLDWISRDRALRRIIAIDPTRVWAIAELVLMLQAAGLTRESFNWNERAISLVPLSMDFLSKRALKLWIAGRVSAADKVIDQVRALYPTAQWTWWCRFLIFAMTGRTPAADNMFRSNPKMVPDPAEAAMWRAALPALMNPTAAAVSHAREACFSAAREVNQTHGQGVMVLSALGDVDGAYAIADGSLLARGPVILQERPGSKAAIQNAIDRVNMQWIFTPPCAAMRSDPRFGPLSNDIGLTEYWRRRGVEPDYLKADRQNRA